MALELHSDHLPARREGFEQRPEIEVDGHQTTVEQHEWPAGTARLVVELQAVHRCVRHASYDAAQPAYSSLIAWQGGRPVAVAGIADWRDPRPPSRGIGVSAAGLGRPQAGCCRHLPEA